MKKLREQIGLTQTEMAKLIGSNKTTSSLYEKGLRGISPEALTRLSTIEVLMENPARIQADEKINLKEQKALAAMLKKLDYIHKKAQYRREILREKLSRMEAAYASNLKLWRLLSELTINLKDEAANPYAALFEIRCLEKLKSCGLDQQILLRHQLAVLEGEMASAKKIVEEYKGFGVPKM